MAIGALAPWVQTPVVSISGWEGIGFPIVIGAFVVIVLQLMHGLLPRRTWLVLSILIGGVTFIAAIGLMLLISTASGIGHFLALLLAWGSHQSALQNTSLASVAWGLYLLAVASIGLTVASIAGLFGKFPVPRSPAFVRRARSQIGVGQQDRESAEPGVEASGETLNEDWFKTT